MSGNTVTPARDFSYGGKPGRDGKDGRGVARFEQPDGPQTALVRYTDGNTDSLTLPQGPAGTKGADGSQGSPGPRGLQGDKGADSTVPGPQGNQGTQGIQGPKGDQGPYGNGSGNVVGPSSSTTGNLFAFGNGTGTTATDSGVSAQSLADDAFLNALIFGA